MKEHFNKKFNEGDVSKVISELNISLNENVASVLPMIKNFDSSVKKTVIESGKTTVNLNGTSYL